MEHAAEHLTGILYGLMQKNLCLRSPMVLTLIQLPQRRMLTMYWYISMLLNVLRKGIP